MFSVALNVVHMYTAITYSNCVVVIISYQRALEEDNELTPELSHLLQKTEK